MARVAPASSPPRPGGSAPPARSPGRLIAAVLLFLLAPVVYETACLAVANWRGMIGQVQPVDTPVLDWINARGTDLGHLALQQARRPFRELPWEPSLVIGAGLAWALVMSLPLKSRG